MFVRIEPAGEVSKDWLQDKILLTGEIQSLSNNFYEHTQ